jgi:hypothetical protein
VLSTACLLTHSYRFLGSTALQEVAILLCYIPFASVSSLSTLVIHFLPLPFISVYAFPHFSIPILLLPLS